MPLYVGKNVKDVRPAHAGYAETVDDIAEFLRGYAGIPKGEFYWLSVELTDGKRYAAGVKAVHALVIDIDESMTLDEGRARAIELGHPCVIYTSASHQKQKDDKPPCDRFRMVFPLAKSVVGRAWADFYPSLCEYIGVPFDPACKDPSRLWYAPQDAEHIEAINGGGPLLDPKTITVRPPAPPVEKPRTGRPTGTNVSDRPGDDYAARNTWRDILEPLGWKLVGRAGREERWQRPGKSGDQHSATAYHSGSENLHVFTPSVPELEQDANYSRFGFYSAMYHGGDQQAAARQLAKDGYGKPAERPKSKDESARYAHIPNEPEPPGAETGEADPGKFSPTDLGNALRFVRLYGQDIRHCHAWGKWVTWGKVWTQDHTGGAVAMQLMIEMIGGIAKEAFRCDDEDKQKAMLSWAGKCQAIAPRNNALADVQKRPEITVVPDDFDRDRHLICLSNGTYDLRSMQIREHRREDYITKLIDIPYMPEVDCPFWKQFLERVLDHDEELIRYIQKALGYTLSGETSEKCFFFLHGSGNNGKTVFIETVTRILGPYAKQLDIEALMLQQSASQSATNDLAGLKAARMVVSSETEDGRRLLESKIKRLTGGDTITCRFLHQEFFSYLPEFKIWIAGNHKPSIRGTDEGIWSRVHLIPFEVCIPREQRIPASEIYARMSAELPGILAWMIEGYRLWKAEGLKKPKAVENAVGSYRDDSDVFGKFLAECTDKDEFADGIKASELYAAYTRWSKRQGEKAPQTMQKFGRVMSDRGEPCKKTEEGKFYTGRSLKDEPQQPAMYWKD